MSFATFNFSILCIEFWLLMYLITVLFIVCTWTPYALCVIEDLPLFTCFSSVFDKVSNIGVHLQNKFKEVSVWVLPQPKTLECYNTDRRMFCLQWMQLKDTHILSVFIYSANYGHKKIPVYGISALQLCFPIYICI